MDAGQQCVPAGRYSPACRQTAPARGAGRLRRARGKLKVRGHLLRAGDASNYLDRLQLGAVTGVSSGVSAQSCRAAVGHSTRLVLSGPVILVCRLGISFPWFLAAWLGKI